MSGSRVAILSLVVQNVLSFDSIIMQDLPQGERWGNVDAAGASIGDGCLLCLSTASEGWPSDSWPELAKRFETDKTFKVAFKAAKAFRKNLGFDQVWKPPSSVTSTICRVRSVYSEIGFITESELTKLCGVGSKALKLKPGHIQLEDRNETLQGFYVSLFDIPSNFANGIRKIKLEWRTSTQHDTHRLSADRQIKQDQGVLTFDYCVQQALDKVDSNLRTVNRAKLPTVPSLIEKANAILQARWVELCPIVCHADSRSM